ncbi:MAG: O-acetyl-ADP-ribose deacetylase [Planctomycetaceae bacterium]
MIVQFGSSRIEIVQGDMAQQSVDALVNSANPQLCGGAGVDGAIHHAAGPTLKDETRALYPDGCPTGSAVATTAGRLNAKYVFHTVGPVWNGGGSGESEQLTSCYQSCLHLACEHSCQSVAFPAVSTGVYGYPMDLAAETALEVVRNFVIEHQTPTLVRFVLFNAGACGAFMRVLEAMTE